MTEFPNGYLLMREFSTLAEAHQAASKLAAERVANSAFRLIEVSPTAGGAWVCAFDTGFEADLDVSPVNEVVMNAFLSLGPKADPETKSIGIVESESISDVFQSCMHYTETGLTLLEIRVKRAGHPGAYAFFAIPNGAEIQQPTSLPALTVVPLCGDYKRFFI